MSNTIGLIVTWIVILGLLVVFLGMFVLPIWFLRKKTKQKARKNTGVCKYCGERAAKLSLKAVTGRIIFFNITVYSEMLCSEHAKQLADMVFRHNIRKGWWSLYGVVRTPFILQENHYFTKQHAKIL